MLDKYPCWIYTGPSLAGIGSDPPNKLLQRQEIMAGIYQYRKHCLHCAEQAYYECLDPHSHPPNPPQKTGQGSKLSPRCSRTRCATGNL